MRIKANWVAAIVALAVGLGVAWLVWTRMSERGATLRAGHSGLAAGPGEAIVFAPVAVELPFDESEYPDLGAGAPSADTINNNCRACHSPSMVMMQPRLTRAEWAGEVAKMRNVYKAPVAPGDDAAIVSWLVAMSEARKAD